MSEKLSLSDTERLVGWRRSPRASSIGAPWARVHRLKGFKRRTGWGLSGNNGSNSRQEGLLSFTGDLVAYRDLPGRHPVTLCL